jgi:hypothetical protein
VDYRDELRQCQPVHHLPEHSSTISPAFTAGEGGVGACCHREIIGGSQREERLEVLDRSTAERGIDREHYAWYRDLRRYGTVPDAGFGLGFEGTLAYVTGLANVRDAIPFPRTREHLETQDIDAYNLCRLKHEAAHLKALSWIKDRAQREPKVPAVVKLSGTDRAVKGDYRLGTLNPRFWPVRFFSLRYRRILDLFLSR